jgi:hypothetical protein
MEPVHRHWLSPREHNLHQRIISLRQRQCNNVLGTDLEHSLVYVMVVMDRGHWK